MDKEVLIYHIKEHWEELEPQLKVGDKVNKELYDELLWFDVMIAQLYDWEFENNYQGYYMTDEIETKDDALKLIIDIAIDYDGYSSADNLRDLVDELREIAKTGLRK